MQGAQGAEQQHPADTGTAATRLSATMRNAQGRDLGILTLTQAGQGMRVSGRLAGLPPGQHAIHLHTTGRCDAPKFESAGGHWNPTNAQHGTRAPGGPHLGDMPNITVGQDSSVAVEVTTPGGTFRNQNALLDTDGAAVVIHAKPDDYRTQPSGDAGDRIACGVVES
jgi:superoxide dismutase, Cu-Zn family